MEECLLFYFLELDIKRRTIMKLFHKTLSVILFLLLCQFVITDFASAKNLTYNNNRYDFTLQLPEADWQIQKSINGDGAVFRSQKFMSTVTSYGTMSYDVLGQNMNAAFMDMRINFSSISSQNINPKEGFFEIIGISKTNKLQSIRCFFRRGVAIIAIVETENNQLKQCFDLISSEVGRSFKPY